MEGPSQDRTEPPADPEEWSDEQWLEWLKATDAAHPGDPSGRAAAGPVTTMGRVAYSPEGRALGQAMLGLAYAIYGRPDDEVVVVAEGSGEPGDNGPVRVELDEEHPERSRAIVRRRRRDGRGGGPRPGR